MIIIDTSNQGLCPLGISIRIIEVQARFLKHNLPIHSLEKVFNHSIPLFGVAKQALFILPNWTYPQ